MDDEFYIDPELLKRRPVFLTGRREPGVNVDKIDVAAGLSEAVNIGYNGPWVQMLIEFCLMRWARGEETAAEMQAIQGVDGVKVDYTAWRRILAAAMAGGAT